MLVIGCCTCFTMALTKEEKPKSRFLLKQDTHNIKQMKQTDTDTSFNFETATDTNGCQ